GEATGTLRIVQAFAGFNQPNDLGAPCASPCFGTPAGTVVVQPNQFVSSNSTGLYYVVLQTNHWTGTLSTTFELSEAGAVVQTVTTGASVGTDQAAAALVLSAAATIPQNSYVGPGVLTAATTATPSNGGAVLTLQSHSTMQVGGAGTRGLVQVFGILSESLPCTGATCGAPSGAVTVNLDQFPSSGSGGGYYAVFQADGWYGDLAITFEVAEGGSVVQTLHRDGFVAPSEAYSVQSLGSTSSPLPGKGLAILSSITTASPGGGQTPFTLTSYSPLQVQ
ncbi:MAG TPA: hypothetical protein VN924_32805, partial [Bryobacteraceae bacterium]|nr:hypothetical protein [Bryobacteraceae bacterium]